MEKSEQPTFSKDRKRRVRCKNCRRFLTMSYLGQTKTIKKRCDKCKLTSEVTPPRIVEDAKGKKGILYGAFESTVTGIDEGFDHDTIKQDINPSCSHEGVHIQLTLG